MWPQGGAIFWPQKALFTIALAMVIYVSKLLSGACSIRACSISKLREMDRVLTPQQQCILLFFLKLPVDKATSKIPPLRERCWYALDTRLLPKEKRPIRDLTTELEFRSNMDPSDILD